jgi:small multidrug resistance pump
VTGTRRARLLLALAILLEVTGTLALRESDGFRQPGWTVVVVLGYASSMVVFARCLTRGMSLSVAYGTLTGTGLLAAALASAVVFREGLTAWSATAMVVLLLGLVLLQRREPEAAA